MSARRVLGLLLAGHVGVASAGSETFTEEGHWLLLPVQPTTRTQVMVRNVVTSCHPPTGAHLVEVDVVARRVDFYYGPDDDTACQFATYFDAYRDTVIGYLPAGTYTLRFGYCDLLTDFQNPPCTLTNAPPNMQFVVTEAGRPRQVIPTLSSAGAFAAALLLAGIAFFRMRPR